LAAPLSPPPRSRLCALGIVLMDKADWHTSGISSCRKTYLSLVFLPPYSPELNPIERLWLHQRQLALALRLPDR
jgi:transposase